MPARFELPEDRPNVALVTIDRPERANALDPTTLRELATAWRRIAADPEIRCAVLTGAGERVFCSGMDLRTTIPLSQRLARGERLDPDDFEGLRAVATALLAGFDLKTPLVCAINGHARAGGFDLMLASEIRYAVPHASFALEEVALGLYPTGNATVLLPRQIPWVHANDLLLSGRPIDATRAAEIGIINRVVAPEALLEDGTRNRRSHCLQRTPRPCARPGGAFASFSRSPSRRATTARKRSARRCARAKIRPKGRVRSSRSENRSGRDADPIAVLAFFTSANLRP